MRYASAYLTEAYQAWLYFIKEQQKWTKNLLDLLKNKKREGIIKKTFKKVH